MAKTLLSLCLISQFIVTGSLSLPDSSASVPSTKINIQLQAVLSTFQRFSPQMSWKMVGMMVTLCSLIPGLWWFRNGKLLSSSAAEVVEAEGAIMRPSVDTNGNCSSETETVLS
jgi:hypothetical protein